MALSKKARAAALQATYKTQYRAKQTSEGENNPCALVGLLLFSTNDHPPILDRAKNAERVRKYRQEVQQIAVKSYGSTDGEPLPVANSV